jgi:hypothetical protein
MFELEIEEATMPPMFLVDFFDALKDGRHVLFAHSE